MNAQVAVLTVGGARWEGLEYLVRPPLLPPETSRTRYCFTTSTDHFGTTKMCFYPVIFSFNFQRGIFLVWNFFFSELSIIFLLNESVRKDLCSIHHVVRGGSVRAEPWNGPMRDFIIQPVFKRSLLSCNRFYFSYKNNYLDDCLLFYFIFLCVKNFFKKSPIPPSTPRSLLIKKKKIPNWPTWRNIDAHTWEEIPSQSYIYEIHPMHIS